MTRGRHVEAAEKLFLRKVFDDTFVEENSEAADDSRGALYSDLDGEGQVFLALIHRRRREALDILDSMFHLTSECGPRSASVRELISNRRRRKEAIAFQNRCSCRRRLPARRRNRQILAGPAQDHCARTDGRGALLGNSRPRYRVRIGPDVYGRGQACV